MTGTYGEIVKDMSSRVFYLALILSLSIHLFVIVYLSSSRVNQISHPVKQIEVTYTNIRIKKIVKENVKSTAIKIVKEDQPSKKIELLPKQNRSTKIFDKIQNFSKTKERFYYDRKLPAKMVTVDINRKISVPLLKSEKITNPKYIGYNQAIHKKIYDTAQRYINHPEVREMGGVFFKFILRSDGTLADLKVVFDRTNAAKPLQKIGEEIIIKSQPFPQFPNGLNFPELPFNMVITFTISSE